MQGDQVRRGGDPRAALVDRGEGQAQVRGEAFELEVGGRDDRMREAADLGRQELGE